MLRGMKRMLQAVLGPALTASVLLFAAPAALAQTASADPPPPASLENHDVEAWAAAYLQTDGWTLLTHDLEGAHLTSAQGVQTMADGLVEAEIRTELFHPIEVGPGRARSGVARWSVDCAGRRLAVLSMTIYSHNNLMGELAKKPAAPRTWQAPNESEVVTIGVICQVARTGGLLAPPTPLAPASPS